LQLKLLSSFGSNILFFYVFSLLMLILLHYCKYISTVLIYLACFLNSQVILKKWHLSLTKSGVSTGVSRRPAAKNTYFLRFVSQMLSFLQIFCKHLSKVETLSIASLNVQLFKRFSCRFTRKVTNTVVSLQELPYYEVV
jgi:hypothetical protein